MDPFFVPVMAMVFQDTQESLEVLRLGVLLDSHCRCVAILNPGQGDQIEQAWENESSQPPLVMIHARDRDRFQLALKLVALHRQAAEVLLVGQHEHAADPMAFAHFVAQVERHICVRAVGADSPPGRSCGKFG